MISKWNTRATDTLTAQRDEMLEALREAVDVFGVEVYLSNPTIRKIRAIISKADSQKVGDHA